MRKIREMISSLKKGLLQGIFGESEISSQEIDTLQNALEKELENCPKIALIGETGVGKSSTINSLFNAGLEINHVVSCTQYEQEIHAPNGKIRVFDMPGLGEDIEKDQIHLNTYRKILPECDVVMWIVKADNRAISNIQSSLLLLLKENILDPEHFLIGINQVDLLQPGQWNEDYNVPSSTQLRSITERTQDLIYRLKNIVKISENRFVAYSALKRYRMEDLLKAMQDACEKSRQWLLLQTAECADFRSLSKRTIPSSE